MHDKCIREDLPKGRTYADITSVTPTAGMEAQVPQASNLMMRINGSRCRKEPVQPAPAQPAPQATTTVTVDQPQSSPVQAQTQMFSQPSQGQSVPF